MNKSLKCMVDGCNNIGTIEDSLGQKMCYECLDKLIKRDSRK